jgi:hypothetical protein
MKTLRELIAGATPGPWKAGSRRGYNRNTIVAQSKVGEHDDKSVAQIYGIPINHHTEDALGERWAEGDANAQLISRCSPDTMLLVVDYLETVKQHCESPLRDCINVDHLQKMTNELLSTLNGQPAKNK